MTKNGNPLGAGIGTPIDVLILLPEVPNEQTGWLPEWSDVSDDEDEKETLEEEKNRPMSAFIA